MKKPEKKPEESINEKPSKLNKKIRKKTNYLFLFIFACKGEKPPKSS